MSLNVKLLMKIANIIFPVLLNQITPALREELKNYLYQLYEKAQETENPFDDLFIHLIITFLGFNKEEEKD